MRKLLLTAGVVILTIAGAAAAGGDDATMAGKPAPEIQVSAWIHGDGRARMADFKGEAVLLEFWQSHCPISRSQVGHLNKLHEAYADRGLVVIGITGEDLTTNLRWFATAADAIPEYAIAVGGGSGYSVTSMPRAFLIGPDGNIVWDGNPGNLAEKDVLVPLLKTVRTGAKDLVDARAASRLAFAEVLAADRMFARAEHEFARIQKLHPSSDAAKTAAARAKEMAGGANGAEYEAQKQVAKLVGGFEHPPEKLRGKDADALSKKLAKLAEDLKTKAPRAAQWAGEWSSVLSQPWK